MNLIEKLGGYEKAKAILQAVGHEHDAMLLEYRRENNIFEVRDRVVSTLNGDEDWKNIVCEVLGFHKSMAITTGFSCAIHHYEYRHATPEEIKAGRRL